MSTPVVEIQAWAAGFGRQAQAFDDLTITQVSLDDLVEVFSVDVGVPDRIRIDDDHRPGFAPIQAAGVVDPYLPGTMNAQLLATFLDIVPRLLRPALTAALPAVVALIDAKEHMV
jgi:hypothetical protein